MMNFTEIAENRQSCRSYDPTRMVEEEKLDRVLAAASLSPSACNGQPYQITVCTGETAKKVAKATQGMGMNKFAADAPVLFSVKLKSAEGHAVAEKRDRDTLGRIGSDFFKNLHIFSS